ncbi:N-sulfoglucosamine sulfohydrolase [Caldisalinibacter kiritimatiensis]|uniref:Arylsulfatase n=1 Tax=Caldisalinibacter kiritimatiensis TaxID=1304284 RepID=R1CN59_9FIRM|nr:N-sulfoglucosamine sulfohydrolase [Caldisalinibacter kiritimatiensis]EOD00146.1 Arylsulfatase [Caldisalinibacter kiritimatiensis]
MNIIYIHTHDTGRLIKPYGYNVPTPNLMGFAKDALLFRNAFCGGPTCSPSRASFLTGRYPHSNGMLGLSHRGFDIKNKGWHMASFFKDNGYETVLCGIQHENRFWIPLQRGDVAAKELGYTKHITADMSNCKDDGDLVKWDLLNAENVVNYLKQASERKEKFFLSYGLFATHREYPELSEDELKYDDLNPNYIHTPKNTYNDEKSRLDMARFYKSAKIADKCFGKVIDVLKETGLYDETVIIFTTDHGIANPFMKCNLTDDGIGISLIIRNPKEPNSHGMVVDSMISQIDVYPTLCDILNLDKPDFLQGKSFIDLFKANKKEVNEYIYAETNFHTSYEPARCIRTKRYKYIRYYDNSWNKYNLSNCDESPSKIHLIKHGWREKMKAREYLFDLYFDPAERNNLANEPEYKDILIELRTELQNWQERTNDPLLEGHINIHSTWKVNKKECILPSSKNPDDYENLPDY